MRINKTMEQLNDALGQLDDLCKTVGWLGEKVSQLEERHNESWQNVDTVVLTIRSFRGIFHHLVQRLSIPIGLDGKGFEDFEVHNGNK